MEQTEEKQQDYTASVEITKGRGVRSLAEPDNLTLGKLYRVLTTDIKERGLSGGWKIQYEHPTL